MDNCGTNCDNDRVYSIPYSTKSSKIEEKLANSKKFLEFNNNYKVR